MLPDGSSRSLAVVLRVRTSPSRHRMAVTSHGKLRTDGREPRNLRCVRVRLLCFFLEAKTAGALDLALITAPSPAVRSPT